jgi:hypothetical protein
MNMQSENGCVGLVSKKIRLIQKLHEIKLLSICAWTSSLFSAL